MDFVTRRIVRIEIGNNDKVREENDEFLNIGQSNMKFRFSVIS